MRLTKEEYKNETTSDRQKRWNTRFSEKKREEGFVSIHMRVRPEVRKSIAVLKKIHKLKNAEQVIEKIISDALVVEGFSIESIDETASLLNTQIQA